MEGGREEERGFKSLCVCCSETYLEVNNYLVHRNITNVIATVYGSVEPG